MRPVVLIQEMMAVVTPDVPLLPPGRIVHITEEKPPRRFAVKTLTSHYRFVASFHLVSPFPCRYFYSHVRYHAEWTDEKEFETILITPKMISDHSCDAVMEALNSLISQFPHRIGTEHCQD